MASKQDFDVLSFSETWFNSTASNASIEIEGHRVYRLDRIGKTGGGVCAYFKNNLKAKILKDLTGISEVRLPSVVATSSEQKTAFHPCLHCLQT